MRTHPDRHVRHCRLGMTLILLSAVYLTFLLGGDDMQERWLAAVFAAGVLTGFVAGRRIN